MTNQELLSTYSTAILNRPYNKSIKTRDSYLGTMNRLLRFLNNKPLADIIIDDIQLYLNSLTTADSTYNQYLEAIGSVYEFFMIDVRTKHIIKSNPTKGIVAIKDKSANKIESEQIITDDEAYRMTRFCKNKRDKAIIVVLLNTGMRIDEVLSMTLEQYMNRDEDGRIVLTHTKGSKERVLYFNDKVVKAIDEYLPSRKCGCEYLFVSNGGNKMDSGNVRNTIRVNASRGGIKEDRLKELHPHLFRRTTLTNLVENGVDIKTVCKISGHSNPSTLLNYYVKENENKIKKAMIG